MKLQSQGLTEVYHQLRVKIADNEEFDCLITVLIDHTFSIQAITAILPQAAKIQLHLGALHKFIVSVNNHRYLLNICTRHVCLYAFVQCFCIDCPHEASPACKDTVSTQHSPLPALTLCPNRMSMRLLTTRPHL